MNEKMLRFVCENGEEILLTEEEAKAVSGRAEEVIQILFERESDDIEPHEFSDDFKRKMNQLFRDCFGGDYIPHPEVEP